MGGWGFRGSGQVLALRLGGGGHERGSNLEALPRLHQLLQPLSHCKKFSHMYNR